MKPEFKLNEKSGNFEADIQSELVSIGNIELTNKNGTKYRIVSVKFINSKGEKQLTSASIFEKNFNHGVTVGKSYLTRVSITPDKQVYLQMSHLENAARATADAFGFEGVASTSQVTPQEFVKA